MADQWLNIYHQNLSNQPPLLSDHEIRNSGLVSDSTVVTAAVSSATTPPGSGPSLSPDGRVGKPVRKRSRASRRTPTTLLNTDAANFRAMVQQFTGGPTSNNASNFTFGFPGSTHSVYDPSSAAAYHIPAPPQQAQLFQYQGQQPPPFMFSLGDSPALFQTHGGGPRNDNNNVADYMGLFDGPAPPPHQPRPS
ncbi:VQ motif-containing protein 22-like [Momordica charantia]|uniref:VQ motif-containing protein 22-like n=1 Tax=Momordica charantia TaxID=3673 RepID=A0A6J1CCZ8_MOMCH|nr:VQ motif-containing protein 22-like [Momordica charantia]